MMTSKLGTWARRHDNLIHLQMIQRRVIQQLVVQSTFDKVDSGLWHLNNAIHFKIPSFTVILINIIMICSVCCCQFNPSSVAHGGHKHLHYNIQVATLNIKSKLLRITNLHINVIYMIYNQPYWYSWPHCALILSNFIRQIIN